MALLRHTTADVAERKALTINPAKTCQPVGAMYAALGIKNCLPHSHGSQGCCSYHRSTLTRHYKEPVMAGTSSFTEGSSVFGGQSNLVQAIDNMFKIYKPDVIAIHTTCLSETIGDDMTQIHKKAETDGKIPEGKRVIYCNTPSYVGSHVDGFSNMVCGMVKLLAEETEEKLRTINIIPGWVEPADMREIKRVCKVMGVETVLYPDTSGVLDAPQTGKRSFFAEGGTPAEEIVKSGSSQATIGCGPKASGPATELLDTKCGVAPHIVDLPIGISATDRFVNVLRKVAGVPVAKEIEVERGQLVDIITDYHQYFYGKRVALWGDPDQLVALAEFCCDLDMRPVYIVTGTPGKIFTKRVEERIAGRCPEAKIACGQRADMFLMHQWIKNEGVDLMIGNTYGKYIARDEDIPFIRHGFPILDRMKHLYSPTVGYRGAINLCEQILTAFLDRKDRDEPEESFELVL